MPAMTLWYGASWCGLIVVTGCRPHHTVSAIADPALPIVEGPAYYIPVTKDDAIALQWYSRDFLDMGEPRLRGAKVPHGMTVMRMLWDRSFDPAVAVRMVEWPGHCIVTVATVDMLEYKWGPPDSNGRSESEGTVPRKLLRRDSVEVAPQFCAVIRQDALERDLWRSQDDPTYQGLDGDDTVFELVDSTGYRVAQRWSADEKHSPEFYEAWSRFIEIGNVNPGMRRFTPDWTPWAKRR